MDIKDIIDLFKENTFYPLEDRAEILPNKKGLYLICVKNIKVLPQNMHNLTFTYF